MRHRSLRVACALLLLAAPAAAQTTAVAEIAAYVRDLRGRPLPRRREPTG